MKTPLMLFLIMASTVSAYCQSQDSHRNEAALFLKSFFKKQQGTDRVIILLESVDTSTINLIRDKLLSKPIRVKRTINAAEITDSITFSDEEKKVIRSVFASPCKAKLTNVDQINSLVLSADSASAIRQRSNCLECVLEERFGTKRLYTLTTPIFLRRNTICIFYYGYSCGPLCGQGSLAIFKKEKGIWKNWIALLDWNN